MEYFAAQYQGGSGALLDGGVLMTEEERSNVNELDEAAQSLALQVRSAFENSSQFGGMFIDRDAHRVVFLAVGEAVVMRRAVTAADKSQTSSGRGPVGL